MPIEGRNLVDGRWREAAAGDDSFNPSRPAELIGRFARADARLVGEACAAARRALPSWSATLPGRRHEILRRMSLLLSERAEPLGALLAREEGKTLREGVGEVNRAASCFDYFSGEAFRAPGEFLPGLRPGFNVTVTREPVGVVAIVTPFNFPIALPAWKIAAALVYGNTAVFKPSELTPALGLALVEVAIEAGLPAGVLNLVFGPGSEIGDALVDHSDAITFTGSGPVGSLILQRAALGMKKVQLELGGKNPLVIAADANLDHAVDTALDGAFFASGQRCTASSRLIVERSIHDRFVDALAEKVAALRVGDALAPDTQIGPVVSAAQRERIMNYVEIGRLEGASAIVGGEPLSTETGGYFVAPTLFVGASNAMRIAREEIFGPVAAVIVAEDLDEAIGMANDTPFGLSSGICTGRLHTAERFRRASRAGLVTVNAPTAGIDFHAPFGGRHASAMGGSEQGSAAIEFYTERKTTYFNHGIV
ncbi:aldehyde dehydrogenase family protein [Bosea sp. RCC_152_1]|uniref:aldehyde dehydrogenase family protein n=1 Tax=Bosea sp. RCC_152_1 TaxID=3239228 RepID=UPI003524103C